MATLHKKFKNEPDLCSKKEALLIQKIEEYVVTFANLRADVKTLKETNMKLQER